MHGRQEIGPQRTEAREAPQAEVPRTPLPRIPVNRLLKEGPALYRDTVDHGEGDFRELSGLLFGAKKRYRSASATITHAVDGAVA